MNVLCFGYRSWALNIYDGLADKSKCDLTTNTLFIHPLLISFITYGGLLFDLFIGFLLFYKRTRLFAFILVIIFNTMNYFLFLGNSEIGVFPFIMIATLILFMSFDQNFKALC